MEVKLSQREAMRVIGWYSLHDTASHDDSEYNRQQKNAQSEHSVHAATVATSFEQPSRPTQDKSDTEYLPPTQANATARDARHPSLSDTEDHRLSFRIDT